MNLLRVTLGVCIALALLATRPVLSAVRHESGLSDPEAMYTVRVEPGTSDRVRFRLIEPRGDSVIEADRFDFIVSAKGLKIRPATPATASGTAGAKLTFESFLLFLPTDGSPTLLEGSIVK
jgi:hypothetical protein